MGPKNEPAVEGQWRFEIETAKPPSAERAC